MQSTELQLNDLVMVGNQVVKVTSLGEYTINGQPATMFHPIPLTTEVLEASGFELNEKASSTTRKFYDFPKKNHMGFGVESYVGGNLFIITDHQLMPFGNIHEFQHALRQCDLKVLAATLKLRKL